jgi:putative Mg2+ transporter-C (MgtC) family protein
MTSADFVVRLMTAILCGAAVGVERQWRQRTAGLRTYTLVAAGSSLFVMVSVLTREDASPTRIAAQVVTGIGFLGAGVIMRSGLNVRGLNTAATIWCSSAVGTLAGLGHLMHAVGGTVAVLIINVVFRPLVQLINRQPVDLSEQEYRYSVQVTCLGRQEVQLRALLVQLTTVSPLVLQELESVVGRTQTHVVLKATLSSAEREDAQIEQIVSRLSLEKNVVGISWQFLDQGKID